MWFLSCLGQDWFGEFPCCTYIIQPFSLLEPKSLIVLTVYSIYTKIIGIYHLCFINHFLYSILTVFQYSILTFKTALKELCSLKVFLFQINKNVPLQNSFICWKKLLLSLKQFFPTYTPQNRQAFSRLIQCAQYFR